MRRRNTRRIKERTAMSLKQAFSISLGAMSAQSLRLNLVASNVANADVSAPSFDQAYRAAKPYFVSRELGNGASALSTQAVVKSPALPKMKYDPTDPMANPQGYVWKPNVDLAAEVADMITASRSYQLNADVAQVSKTLMDRALAIGQ